MPRLTTKSQLVALLYAQFSGASSLREIEAGMNSHAPRLYHLGAAPARRSTLADANALRPGGICRSGMARQERDAWGRMAATSAIHSLLVSSANVLYHLAQSNQSPTGWLSPAPICQGVQAITAIVDDDDEI